MTFSEVSRGFQSFKDHLKKIKIRIFVLQRCGSVSAY